MVSGSAALPLQILERWRQLTGHELLERYGMTEIGMALADPLHGDRVPGHVGHPLPSVDVRRVDERGEVLTDPLAQGELEVRGPSVFSEYWRSPEATTAAFRDGWFRTGDVAVMMDGHYRLLGRISVDIIKTGGHKVSALEIEEVIREHPKVRDCAVVGVPDAEWGERVSVALIGHEGERLNPEDLVTWVRDRLAPYKVPRNSLVLEDLPRNSMGKVLKHEVRSLFESPTTVEEGHEEPVSEEDKR
jgi:malonyl-CoA/methylmalonyl-CoA synthetase